MGYTWSPVSRLDSTLPTDKEQAMNLMDIAAEVTGATPSTQPDRVLDIATLVALGTVADAASHGSHVRWTPDMGETIHSGTARSIGDENFNFLNGTDVRDGFLRITGDNGREFTLSIMDVVDWVQHGGFAVDA